MITNVSKKVTVSAVAPKMLHIIWPLVSNMVEAAIEHSNKELTLDSIYDRLLETEMVLITAMEQDNVMAALTLEKNHFPSGKTVLTITTAGGADMHLWMDKALALCEQIAKQQDCEELYVIGRAGWGKVLKEKDFDTIHTVLSKKVGG